MPQPGSSRNSTQFLNPPDAEARLSATPWLSYSLTACVGALLEIENVQAIPYFEDGPAGEWFKRLDAWASTVGFQPLITSADIARTWNIRIVYSSAHHVVFDGVQHMRCSAVLFCGPEPYWDPFPCEGQRHPSEQCVVFVPNDPKPFRITFN